MSSTNTLINHIVRDRLKQIAPDEYAKCVALTEPMIADVSYIPIVALLLGDKYKGTGNDLVFMIAVMHRIFFPYKNHYQNLKLGIGLPQVIQAAFGLNHRELYNHYAKYIIPAYKGERYRQRVEDEALSILNQLNNN
jgi:hypothetical protein